MPTSSEYGSEVHELCLELYVTEQMSYDKIAQHLYDNKIVHKVFHRSTILRWCNEADENIEEAQTLRQRVEHSVAAADYDRARQLAYEILGEDDPAVIKAKSEALNSFLGMRTVRSRAYGTDAPKRKEVAVTTGGVTVDQLREKAKEWDIRFGPSFGQGDGEQSAESVDQS